MGANLPTVLESLRAALADRYRIERELGAGGMATVFLAEDLKHHRHVAIKVLRPELAQALGAERFLREIEIAANLTHPHILPVHDSGTASGFLYYVMPYVEGESLRQRLARDGALPVPEAARLLAEVADALAKAHRAGVVHRDIKPENIMLADGHALVTDFGVARAVTVAGAAGLTTGGMAVGTPAYMAPEQASADPHVDHRADLYSLGIVGYEMVTGRPPFTGATAQQVLAAQVTEMPEPVAKRRAAVPPALAGLVDRCLAKHPGDRPQSAEELARLLTTFATPSGEASVIKPLAFGVRRVPRAIWFAVGVILAAALSAWAVLGRGGPRSGREAPAALRSIAVLPLENIGHDSAQEYFADGITDELTSALGKVPGLQVAARTSAFSFKGKTVDPHELASKLGVATVLEGRIQRVGDRLRVRAQLISTSTGLALWSQTYEREAKDVFAVQDEITTAIVAELKLKLESTQLAASRSGRTSNPAAHDLYLRGRALTYGSSESERRQGLAYFRRAVQLDPKYAQAEAGIAFAWQQLADVYVASPDANREVKAAALRALALDSLLAEAHAALAYALIAVDRDWAGGDREFDHAIVIDPNSVDARYLHAATQMFGGRLDASIAEAREVVRLDPLSPGGSWELEVAYYLARRYDDAIAQHRKSAELDPRYVYLDWFVGAAYREKGMLREALAEYERAQSIAGDRPLYGLAVTYARMGRSGEARGVLRKLSEFSREHYVDPVMFAMVHAALGEKDQALTLLDRAVRGHYSLALAIHAFPEFDSLRGDPRFEDLRRQIGLAPGH